MSNGKQVETSKDNVPKKGELEGKVTDKIAPDDGRVKQRPKKEHKGNWGRHN